MPTSSPNVDGFQHAAEEFCSLVEQAAPYQREDLWRFRQLLTRLIFHIPAVELHPHAADFDGRRMDDDQYQLAFKKLCQFPVNEYRVVFSPFDFAASDEPVIGMLADDLADIYRDLGEGLDNARNGHLDDACFDWMESYRSHWARHAVNALAAIEIFRTDNSEEMNLWQL